MALKSVSHAHQERLPVDGPLWFVRMAWVQLVQSLGCAAAVRRLEARFQRCSPCLCPDHAPGQLAKIRGGRGGESKITSGEIWSFHSRLFQVAFKMIGMLEASVTAERSMKAAVDFSPRIGEGTAFRRVATAEPLGKREEFHAPCPIIRRSATRASWHIHRGLKSTATVVDRSAVSLIFKANWNYTVVERVRLGRTSGDSRSRRRRQNRRFAAGCD